MIVNTILNRSTSVSLTKQSMNALVSQSKPCLVSTGARAPVRSTVACKAQPRHQIISEVLEGVKHAALIATAAGVLSAVRAH